MEILRTIDMNEEAEIKAMQKRQRELHLIPTPVCYLDLEVVNKNGEITAKYTDRSKSWTRNFYNFCVMQQMALSPGLLGDAFGAGYLGMKSITGNAISNPSGYTYPPKFMYSENESGDNGFKGIAGSVTTGIVIGTGDTAESLNSYALGAIIDNGSGTGQMNYAAMSASGVVWDDTGKAMKKTLERTIVNNSGGTIIVKETGLIGRIYFTTTTSSGQNILCARDVLSTPASVAHESQIKVTYTVQIAYPS